MLHQYAHMRLELQHYPFRDGRVLVSYRAFREVMGCFERQDSGPLMPTAFRCMLSWNNFLRGNSEAVNNGAAS